MIRWSSASTGALVFVLAAALAGCSSPGPRPDSQLSAAESAVRDAESADAREHEPVLLNRAQNKVQDARSLIDQEEYPEAERLLEQAVVDARLASARSESARVQQAVDELNESIESLRRQMNGEQ